MTLEVTVTQDDDVFVTLPQVSVERDDEVIVVLQDDLSPSIVVTLDEETEVIQTVEQGPPGTQGPQGEQGAPGAPGSAGISEAPVDGRTYGRKNALWADVTNASASVLVLDEPPIGAADGSLWYESDTGLLYIRYNDGNTTQWVVAPKITSLPDAPSDGKYYGRLNATWFPVAPLASPAFTGTPTAPTPAAGIHDDTLATTAFVAGAMSNIGAGYAPLNSPLFTGDPRAPTPGAGDNDTSIATTAFVQTAFAAGTAGKEDKVSKGVPNGYASLNSSGLVPASQLPAYVDEVQEYPNVASFPAVGSPNIIYVADDTNKTYRWSGTGYVEISSSPGTTDAVPEGSVNLYFTDARAAAAAPVQSVAGKTGAVSLAKSDVGLANVDNTSDLNKPISTATQSALNLKAQLASPALTGFPTAPTAAPGTGTTQIATTEFVAAAVASGGSYEEAPQDGGYYGRLNATWAHVAPLASPVFSGDPRAPTPAPGDADTSIATTGFVAAAIAAIPPPAAMTAVNVTYTPTGNIASTNVQAALTEVDAEKVAKSGDTMTGHLTLPSGPAAANAVRKDYVDAADAALQTNINAKASTTYVDAQDALKVAKAGDTMTGHLTLPAGPAAANAVRKDYVDAGDTAATAVANTKVTKAGDTMTGQLTTAASALAIAAATGGPSNAIQIMGDGAGASYVTFHRPGSFAAHLGLDTDNQWRVGGWSMGAVSYKLWHEGNFAPGSYVAKAGDTMSGGLSLGSTAVGSATDLSRHIALYGAQYGFSITGGTLNLVANSVAQMQLQNGNVAVTGNMTMSGSLTVNGNIATNAFSCSTINTNGNTITAGAVNASGSMQVDGNFHVNGVLQTNSYVMSSSNSDYGIYYFGNSGGRYLQYNAGQLNYVGLGALVMGGAPISGAGAFSCTSINTTSSLQLGNSDYGLIYFGNTYGRYIEQNGARFNFYGGPIYTNYGINVGGGIVSSGDVRVGGNINVGGGNMYVFDQPLFTRSSPYTNFYDENGNICYIMGGNGDPSNYFRNNVNYFQDHAGSNSAYAYGGNIWTPGNGYKPGGGSWADSSDIRIKNVLGDYEHGLDQILALKPKRFTFKGNDTPGEPSNYSEPDAPAVREAPVVPYKNSLHYEAAKTAKEFIGLIAQDTDLVMPEMVNSHDGYIDGEATAILDIDTTPLVYALINAVKTLTARVELLEGQLASRAMQ